MASSLRAIFDQDQSQKAANAPIVKETGKDESDPNSDTPFDDQELLALHTEYKREAFDQRSVFERQWTRLLWYVIGRQWIEYFSRDGQWKDKRLAKWIPRPVTNVCRTTLQAIRAMFAAIELGVNCRPNGDDPKNISVAEICDQLTPLHHANYNMDAVLSEFDGWLITLGNAYLYSYWDYDVRHGMISVKVYECADCMERVTEDRIKGLQPVCPGCQSPNIAPALDEMTGQPAMQKIAKGKGVTDALSGFELVYPNSYPRFEEVPFVYRLRWRNKSYYENHPVLKEMVPQLSFSKSPEDRSLQIFKSLATQNDMGVSPVAWSEGTSSNGQEEGITEYELWVKPTDKYPDGLVVRFIGEKDPKVLHLEDSEGVPGPLPYVDADKLPVWPFSHAGYEPVNGRCLASGALDPIVQKQDQLNQLDSMIQMIIQRMANPIWLEPKGAEVEKFTGEPGLVVKWNPLTVQGNAKPERIAGEGPHSSLFQIREQYLKDIEELAGTFDIVKGSKPTGVEAFSALSLLDERSKSRFATVFKSRAAAYAHNAKVQLELEREFGPDKITKAVLSPAKTYTYQTFLKANLQGSVSVVVESGTQAPKTSLGKRAAIEHLNTLGFLNPEDPDQRHKIYQEFGMTSLSPMLDRHVTSALRKQQAFEEWAVDEKKLQEWAVTTQQQQMEYEQQAAVQQQAQAQAPVDPATGVPAPAPAMAPPPSPLDTTPLKWRQWYSPAIHEQEFLKWANGDTVQQLITQNPDLAGLLEGHLLEIRIAKMEEMAGMIAGQPLADGPPPAAPAGGPGKPGDKKKPNGSAMENSNRESTQGNEPKGNGQGAQNHGPA